MPRKKKKKKKKKNAIKKVQENQERLALDETHQLLAYADNVNIRRSTKKIKLVSCPWA
jgi:hypothetical protein